MIVLVGESGSGKSTIEKVLVEKYYYTKVISYTTRKPRKGEVDGVDYHFVDSETFMQMMENDEFVETAVYNNWYYGSAKKDYTDGSVAVLTPHGMRQLKKAGIKFKSFYIRVPRRDRLIRILQRGDNIEEAYRRSLSDVGQFDGIKDEVDYEICNEGYLLSAESIAGNIMMTDRNEYFD